MGLMDKVRAQAAQIAQKTQETARDSKVKFDQAQAKRRGDVMLRNLGAVVYADRTGRGTQETAAEIDRLVTEITSHEAENEISLAREPADAAAADMPAGGPAEAAAEGSPPAAESPPAEGLPPPESAGFPPSAPMPPPQPPAPPSAPPAEGFPPEAPEGFPPEAPTGFPPEAG
jgi:hypothetical protein